MSRVPCHLSSIIKPFLDSSLSRSTLMCYKIIHHVREKSYQGSYENIWIGYYHILVRTTCLNNRPLIFIIARLHEKIRDSYMCSTWLSRYDEIGLYDKKTSAKVFKLFKSQSRTFSRKSTYKRRIAGNCPLKLPFSVIFSWVSDKIISSYSDSYKTLDDKL